jgi:glutamate racemase
MLKAELDVPVVGVIEPGAQAAVAAASNDVIGVIGTAGTVASGAYTRAIHAIEPDATVLSQACPLFVPLVEEGWVDHAATRLVAHEYLDSLIAANVRALVLGCTHYPLLKPLLAELMGDRVELVDSAEATAAETARVLDAHDLRTTSTTPTHRFVASDASSQFLRLGQRFLGATIESVDTVTLG